MLFIKPKLFFLNRLLPFFIFFLAFIAMSPILAYLGIRGIFSSIFILIISLFFIIISSLSFKKKFINIFLYIIITTLITAIYWFDLRYLIANFFLIIALFLFQFTNLKTINFVIDFTSVFLLIVTVGAVLGFIIAFVGIPELFQFPNPDGRINFFYYTTLTNTRWGNIIRPSGIYDEPGALSFYICSIAVLRQLFSKSKRITWILLILGLVTFSLAHIIYMFFHLISESFSKKTIRSFFFLFSLSVSIIYISGFNILLEQKLFKRLQISEYSGSINGDNRSFQMDNIIDYIKKDKYIFSFGVHSSCLFDFEECKSRYPLTDANPLTPLFYRGIFVSWPFYISLLYLFSLIFINRKYFVTFAFGLLLLQRPEMLSLPGSMISVLIIGTSLMFINSKIGHSG